MDRLSALNIPLALVVALGGCKSESDKPLPGRADTTKVAQKNVSTEAFCDVQFNGTTGPKFTVPPLVGGSVAATAPTWRWINVWATWCKPCVEEMPRLAKWREKLGAKYELSFISVDENEQDLVEFRKAHPDTPASPRLADPAKQADWLVSLGLDGGAPVPIHIFVEPSGHVRCARAGGVREQDLPAIEKLLSQ
jgi:thiol-disulfide isomerase/thioredoxin